MTMRSATILGILGVNIGGQTIMSSNESQLLSACNASPGSSGINTISLPEQLVTIGDVAKNDTSPYSSLPLYAGKI